jgi:hypothetical protein
MAGKFFGLIGYGETVRTSPGVSEDIIVERKYYGDIKRNSRRGDDGQQVNLDINVGASISIVSDAYANEHFFAIRYVKWAGTLWTVQTVEVKSPRLLLHLGGVYNGPTPDPSTP